MFTLLKGANIVGVCERIKDSKMAQFSTASVYSLDFSGILFHSILRVCKYCLAGVALIPFIFLQTLIKDYNFKENCFCNTINSLAKWFGVATAAPA